MPATADEAGPQALRPLLRIIVEALAVLAAEALLRDDHRLQHFLLRRIDGVGAEILLGRQQDFPAEIDADFVVERQRPDRHARHFGGVLDHRRRHALHQHQMALADVIADAAIGVEAAAIVDDDRRLLDCAHEVHRHRQRLRSGLLAHDDLDQHHPVDRREEMHADEILGLLATSRRAR